MLCYVMSWLRTVMRPKMSGIVVVSVSDAVRAMSDAEKRALDSLIAASDAASQQLITNAEM